MRRLRPSVVALLVLTALVLVAVPAQSQELTREEVTDLAEIAAHDSDARERLERVDVVDGRTVDMERYLDGAQGNEVVERIEVLVGSGPSGAGATVPSATQAREEARTILSDERFRPAPVPRPFRGILETLARWLDPVLDAIASFFDWIAEAFRFLALGTGGAFGLWLVIAAIVVAITVVRTRAVVAERAQSRRSASLVREAGDDPKRLEILAAEAEERGDHDLAVRLRFRAGVLRLGAARVIPRRLSLTTGELRRLLASPEFDRLGRAFDEIAYGGRVAAAEDTAHARTAWASVLKEKVGK